MGCDCMLGGRYSVADARAELVGRAAERAVVVHARIAVAHAEEAAAALRRPAVEDRERARIALRRGAVEQLFLRRAALCRAELERDLERGRRRFRDLVALERLLRARVAVRSRA